MTKKKNGGTVQLKLANVDTVLRSVKDTSCLTLCQNLDTECM